MRMKLIKYRKGIKIKKRGKKLKCFNYRSYLLHHGSADPTYNCRRREIRRIEEM